MPIDEKTVKADARDTIFELHRIELVGHAHLRCRFRYHIGPHGVLADEYFVDVPMGLIQSLSLKTIMGLKTTGQHIREGNIEPLTDRLNGRFRDSLLRRHARPKRTVQND